MPYPNEHAARLADPGKYAKFRRKSRAFGSGIDAIYGITEAGDVELQTIRFAAGKFSASEAKAWLKEHDHDAIKFERATGEKADSMNVRRFDRIPFGTVNRMDDGSITSSAIITRAGIFEYRLPDGTVQKEFRSPEEVFKADSMASAKLLPITNQHPPTVFVDPATVKQYRIGSTGENVECVDNNLAITIKIDDQDGIKAVDNGRREFSCGYEAVTLKQDGMWQGERYTHVQKDIKYNHLALVDQGRAGHVASLRLDAADAIQVAEPTAEPKGKKTMSEQVRLDDGFDYDASKQVKAAYEGLKAKRDDLQVKLDAATEASKTAAAEKDTLQGKCDELQKRVDEFDTTLDEKVKAGIELRSAVLDSAKKVITDAEEAKKLDSMSVADIKRAVIVAKNPDAKLDEKTDEYIAGAFEIAVASGAPSKQASNGAGIVGDGSRKADEAKDPEQAKLDAMEEAAKASRAPLGVAAK